MKNQLSRFDIGMIIAFVVVALLGAGGWWWLSGELDTAIADTKTAATDFDKYSKMEVFLPTKQNVTILQNNIDLMTAQLDPIVANRLQSAKSGLKGVHAVDTVDWKHDLDEEVSRLNAAAATHGIIVPKNFYYGFSRYLSANPAESATDVLKRQQIAVEAIANILINAPVKAIVSVKRTAEEDPKPTASGPGAPAPAVSSGQLAPDILPGRSVEAPGGVYTAYPLEFQFDTDTESFRDVISQIMQSDYVFVLRSVMVQNSRLDSPPLGSLDTMAGITAQPTPPGNQPSILASPGAVAAAVPPPPTIGLQYLFGDETLHVRVMLDLIDWHGVAQPETTPKGGRSPNGTPAHPAPRTPATPATNTPTT